MKIAVVLSSEPMIALFRGEIETGEDLGAVPSVSLSRAKGKCFFRLDQLDGHDSHAPTFETPELRQVYVDRIIGDIKAALETKGMQVEMHIMKAPPVLPVNGHGDIPPMPPALSI